MFPRALRWPLGHWVNAWLDWLIEQHGSLFASMSNALLLVLVKFEGLLRGLPWWSIVLTIMGIGYHATRRLWVTIGLGAALVLIGSLGLWDHAMQTLALMLVATTVGVLMGIPLGVVMSQSRGVRWVLRPVLDAMQTLPSFVYLIPALMLFGLGKVPAIFATVIYAVPPVTRLTDLGIRLVDAEVVEAARAFGATRRQLLFGVQLPLALPTIMAGVNQTMMMALSMVVIASMIGARGLGEEVLLGIQRLDVGRGVEAGIAIVALAIVFDRVSQAYGKSARMPGG